MPKKTKSENVPEVDVENAKFGKKLAHTDKKVRDKGLKIVLSWLKKNGDNMDPIDMMKLWKSLWYAYWMSDKPLIQRELAINLALTINSLPDHQVPLWIAAFWETQQSSWESIDRHRIDKYLMLARLFLAETLKFIRERDWNSELIKDINEMYTDVSPLVPGVGKGVGLSIQFASMWITEFKAQYEIKECSKKIFMQLLEPFFQMVVKGTVPTLTDAICNKLFQEVPENISLNVQMKLMELSGDKKLHHEKRTLFTDTVLIMRGEKKEAIHPCLGKRSRDQVDQSWERTKKKGKVEKEKPFTVVPNKGKNTTEIH